MHAYGTAVCATLIFNAIVWYPVIRWHGDQGRFQLPYTSLAPTWAQGSGAWVSYTGTLAVSTMISVDLLWTYGTDEIFERIVRTHCGPQTVNVMTSVSAMFAETFNMRLAMMVTSPVILINSLVTHLVGRRAHAPLKRLSLIISLVEWVSLNSLVAISSKDNHSVHVAATTLWFLTTLAYVIINTCVRLREQDASAPQELTADMIVVASAASQSDYHRGSRMLRRLWYHLAAVHVLAGLLAIAMYILHNGSCWSYTFSVFGMAEIVLVASNIGLNTIEGLENRALRVGATLLTTQ